MPRFFANLSQINDNSIVINGEDAKHIGVVLRMKKNDKLIVCDGQNTDYSCIIKDISKDLIQLEILEKERNSVEPKIEIKLYQSIPKMDKMEFIIQKCIEVGVDEIIPIVTERTIVKIDKNKINSKYERWNKIAESASKQCMRGKIPKILKPISFLEALNKSKSTDLALIPYEYERLNKLRLSLQGFVGNSISIFIGPEGGFTESEIKLAKQNNLIPITLGKRILRTETAGLVTISNILYELGDE